MPIFMKWGKIEGSATDDKHKAWIGVETATFSISNPANLVTGKGADLRSAGTPTISDIDVEVLDADQGVIELKLEMMREETPADVTIDFVRAKGDPYQQLKLKNALVSNISGIGSESHTLTISCTAFWSVFFNQDEKAKVASQTKAGWDMAANAEWAGDF